MVSPSEICVWNTNTVSCLYISECIFQLEVENKLKTLADTNSRYKTQVSMVP